MTLGDKLKGLRQAKGWTQPEAAGMIGIEQSYLSKLENGKSVPSDEVFDQLLKGYELTIHELIGDLSEAERDKLRDISVVSSYVAISKGKAQQSSDRWTLSAIVCIVFGIGLVLSGITGVFFTGVQYEYAYDGSDEQHNHARRKQEVIEYSNMGLITEEEAKNKLREIGPAPRAKDEYRTSFEYMGSVYQENTEAGTKTFHLIKERHMEVWHNKLMMVLGHMLLAAGVLLLIFMRKWRR